MTDTGTSERTHKLALLTLCSQAKSEQPNKAIGRVFAVIARTPDTPDDTAMPTGATETAIAIPSAGLEPATCGLEDRRSIQLSYEGAT